MGEPPLPGNGPVPSRIPIAYILPFELHNAGDFPVFLNLTVIVMLLCTHVPVPCGGERATSWTVTSSRLCEAGSLLFLLVQCVLQT